MQIIVPMSGMGNRFLEAGYTDPKPLIAVDGKPVIEHVVNLFPGEHNFIFICNSTHLARTSMHRILQRIAPQCRIVEIPPHKKGPVFAVLQAHDMISDEEEVIVNYCDFSSYWDYGDFLKHTRGRNADGAVPAYQGFHPHMLGTTNYAFMRDREQWMLEIREKQPFTDNRMQEYASNGTYYFKKGAYVKKYFTQLIAEDINVNGEYYASMVYNLLVRDGLTVSIYEVQHMLQWGTPQDLEEYSAWSDLFRHAVSTQPIRETVPDSVAVIPLAGRGSRFVNEGYRMPKPLIPVCSRPMIVQAARCLPPTQRYCFACLGEHLDAFPLAEQLGSAFGNSRIVRIDEVTQGQACTVERGLADEDPEARLVIGACDNGMVWDYEAFMKLMCDESVHAVAFSFRHHPSSKLNPQMYGWLQVDDHNTVTGVSVKVPVSDTPFEDHAIVGSFYFRKVRYFVEALQELYRKDVRVNGEFYVDSLMGEMAMLGYTVKAFEVDSYICWGTPDDLRTFEYWQSFFHKCRWHPYCLERDSSVAPEAIPELDSQYRNFTQLYS